MNKEIVSKTFMEHFQQKPSKIERCSIGYGNYVFHVKCNSTNYILRCTTEDNPYEDTIYWLSQLGKLDIPISKVLVKGTYQEYQYLILNYIEGKDIGVVYCELTSKEKMNIAKEVMRIQRKVATLSVKSLDESWVWTSFVDEMLERAENRISQNGYFDIEKVERLKQQKHYLNEYFMSIEPIPYLDDISTKNLLIHNRKLSGIIDVDWMGIGDNLTFIALSYVALLNMEYETDYIDYLLSERGCTKIEKKAFLFYALLFCVDFMGERDSVFGDKKVEVNEEIIDRLNKIYELLWLKWHEKIELVS